MARSKSSRKWLREHFSDPYVQQAQTMGLRSRAAVKLLQIQDQDRIFKPGQTVIDLGAAPGGWCQVAEKAIGPKGRIIALDILPMDPIAGVEFIQGDFSEDEAYNALIDRLDGQGVDLVICDIAPNMSGVRSVDQPKAMYLVELAADFARQTLRNGGHFLVKIFQGEGTDALRAQLKKEYTALKVRKPDASRDRSRELYWLATGFKGSQQK